MSAGVTTLEGIVENGQIRLPDDIKLPERARVYVVIPDIPLAPETRIASPRLARPEQAADFVLQISEDAADGNL